MNSGTEGGGTGKAEEKSKKNVWGKGAKQRVTPHGGGGGKRWVIKIGREYEVLR